VRITGISAIEVLERIEASRMYFGGTKYMKIIECANRAIVQGHLKQASAILSSLPTDEQLLSQLMEKLKGKSVCSTLERIQSGKSVGGYTVMKGLSSLLTHIVIEMEQGHKEFQKLLPVVLHKLNEAGFKVISEGR